MNKPPRDPNESILCKDTLKVVLTRGSIIGIVTILAQYIGMQTSDALGAAMAFSTITLSRIIQTFARQTITAPNAYLLLVNPKLHIGIIRALEENGIPIDYIAGTSMGSIVESLYVSLQI